ncbi:serine/arginine repetitive matrix protein 2-like isoform X1 [Anopheles merus]|uniref:serine/arginine repetitive matrix protein 2-like isoform X1 n=1 Tax=Anopheles merus TaxID=30066 RepID=UPI001BE44C45|nr:serine/arginine repetitive matrix protein 2-like isoform X1 [Anopheles merus]
MAYFMQNVPDLRLSEVDELIRETAMDDSNGQKILEYLRRKRGGARARLYDGSDNSFHFRLDHVQPVTVPQAGNSNRRELSTARSPEAAAAAATAAAPAAAPASPPASSSGALIQPLADLSVENRVSSFITPARLSVALSPVRTGAGNARTTIVTSPTRKSTVHVSPYVSLKPATNLQKQLLLQQYKRSNDMKFEALRHASHLASSTPIAGEQANRKGQNLLNFRETISPILDEQVPGTPTHRPARNSYRGEQGAQVAPATIQTPIPATQDVPDGTGQQNGRENTPPREQNALVVIPETPSPVRRSPRQPCTPLSGLSLAYREHISAVPLAKLLNASLDDRDSASTPSRRSILKNGLGNHVSSPRNRVSFSEKLTVVREISPRVSPEDSQITSDESDEEQANQRVYRSRTSDRGVTLQRSRLTFDFEQEPAPVSPTRSSRRLESAPVSPTRSSNRPELAPNSPTRSSNRFESAPVSPTRSSNRLESNTPVSPTRSSNRSEPAPVSPTRSSNRLETTIPVSPTRSSNRHEQMPVSPTRSSNRQHVQQATSPSKRKPSNGPEPTQNQRQRSAGTETSAHKDTENAQHSRRLFGQGRSNAFDDDGGECKEPASPSRSTANVARSLTRPPSAADHSARPDRQLPRSPANACNNRTNRNTINMIMDEWDEGATSPMEVDHEQGGAGEGETAHRTITDTLAITNVATPRTVVMDILEPPSAFCDDDTANESDSRMPTDQEEPNNRAPSNSQASPDSSDSDSSRKRKQDNLRVLITAVPSPKQSKLSLPQPVGNTTLQVPQHSERLLSVNSPHDHVPLDMIQAVDMIHSKVNSELVEPEPGGGAATERRTTICNPPKRRATKSKVDADTEIYFQTVENTCSQEGPKAKQRKERRKLFVQDPADRMPEDEERQPIPSPVPLPLTQELVDSQEQRVQSKRKQQSVKELAVLVKRLSDVTITRCTQSPDRSAPKVTATVRSSPVASERDEEYDSPVELPVREKQNEERSEKSDQTKEEKQASAKERKEEKCSPPQQVERAASPKRKLKPSGPSKRKKKEKPPAGASSPEPAATEPVAGMAQKYLKDVSNEIRQQIESEGPRRSHRSRRLADEVLRNNPDIARTDAPQYVMPNMKDMLKYFKQFEQTSKKEGKKGKEKGGGSKKEAKRKHEPSNEKDGGFATKSSEKTDKKARGRARKVVNQKEERFDSDGFRIPPAPVVASGSRQGRKTASREEPSESYSLSASNQQEQGTSSDSGLSSAVMTNDDATNTAEANERSEVANPSKQSSSKADRTPSSAEPPNATAASSSSSSASFSGADMLAEKRKVMDWMMVLMENRQNRAAGLPNVELQGFTHLSLEHLAFQRCKGIEYSFYVYSNKDNFGFLRVLPNVTKKTTFTKHCSLKFLILSGALKFIINGYEVNVVGGDFLMIPPSTTYSMVNGSETTLMFMIKATLPESQAETDGQGKR